ncbi:MAG: class I SAM-dependent methyltransferase [Chloroflexota bacterium]|jgi:SAM-dependent methyltransferase
MTPNESFYEPIARFYDAENAEMTEDLALYSALLAEHGGPLLDAGCGTGRVMLHLAAEGARVVGIDRSPAMLERSRRKLASQPHLKRRVTLVEGDVLDATLPGPFKLILMTYNGFLQFTTQAGQLAALRRFAALLADDGLLVLDLPNAGEAFAAQDDGALVLERTFTEPESGHLVMQQSVSALDRVTQRLHITWIYDEILDDGTVQRTLAPLVLRYILPGEMDLMLAAAGLRRVQYFGEYDQEPFVDGCSRMIVLAAKAEQAGP